MEFVLIVGLIVIIYLWIKKYRICDKDTVIAFSGGLGSGKTALSVHFARKVFRRNLLRYHLRRLLLFWKKDHEERPRLYSNVPIMLDGGNKRRPAEYSYQLNNDILLLKTRIPRYSVCLIDEIGSYCSQFDYKNPNSPDFDEFVRFFRHYVRGSLVCNDQCSENIVLQIRRRINTVYNLRRFSKPPILPICFDRVREIVVSEEIKSVETADLQTDKDSFRRFWFIGNPFKYYDSYCYSVRYDDKPADPSTQHTALKQPNLLKIPQSLYSKPVIRAAEPAHPRDPSAILASLKPVPHDQSKDDG